MSDDLAVIRELEAQIGEPIAQVDELHVFDRGTGYQLNDAGRVVRLCLFQKTMKNLEPLLSLTGLLRLGLGQVGIRDFKPLASLTKLTHLRLTFNRIEDVSGLGSLTGLTILTLDNNQIKNVSGLGSLTGLTYLNLGSNQIEDLLPLGFLTGLTHLYLHGNKIEDVSALGSLTGLTHLNLYNNKIEDVSTLGPLASLTRLYLYRNEIEDVSGLGSLTGLTHLNLCNNMIKDVSGLGSLTSLAHLYLHNNKIEDVSGLRSLMGLTNLRLDSNQIEDVSPIAGLLERFGRIREKPSNISSELVLGDNPLKAPPLEIVRQGKEAVLAWFAARGDTGERLLNQVKVLLVGDGYAGKTSLVQRVLHDTFEPNQGQTHGIRIEEWSTDGPKDDPMVVKFWDFGGQEIMHATHQFFLSKRCLYIVVQSARDEDRTWYWLHHIRGFGGDSPVLVVINKIDENPGFEVDENQLQREFPNIIGFYRLSCKKGRGIAGFKNRLCEELPKIELASAIWPERWFQIKEALESMEKPYITRARYRAVCKQHTVDTTDQQRTLLAFLHDLGVMLSFPDLHLRETQVLNPHWATNGVYKIINAKQLADHHGRLDLDKLDEVLAPTEEMPQSYPSETHPFLVELMRKFELCYPLEGEDAVLVPDLLAKNSPADFELRGDTLTFLFDYTFLPPSVMPRFMVRLHKDISFAWRTGVILYDKDTDSRAAVLANQPANRISIEVSGPKRRDYLLVVRFFLRSIHATFTNLKVHEKVQLPDDPVPEHALAYSVLKKAEERGIAELPALNGNFYNVSDLLGRVQIKAPTNEEEERAFLRRTVTTILEKVDKEKPVNFLEDVFDLSSPYLINLNAAKKYLLQIIKKDRR